MRTLHDRQGAVAAARGQGWPLFMVGGALLLLAVGVPTIFAMRGEPFPWENVQRIWIFMGCFVGVVWLIGAAQSRRQVALDEAGELHITGPLWLGRRLRIDELTDVTYQDEWTPGPDHSNLQSYLVFWRNEQVLAKLNILFWNRSELAHLLQVMAVRYPQVQLGPRARKLVA